MSCLLPPTLLFPVIGSKWEGWSLTCEFSLALLELRLLLAKTLWHYDVEVLPESDKWLNQKAYLAWEKPPLMARLTPVQR